VSKGEEDLADNIGGCLTDSTSMNFTTHDFPVIRGLYWTVDNVI
jgi:hypothetical protein